MISSTEFTYDQYGLEGFDGKNSMDEHLQVLGISSREFGSVGRVSVLRCTIINPWFALSRGGKPDYIEAFATTPEGDDRSGGFKPLPLIQNLDSLDNGSPNVHI